GQRDRLAQAQLALAVAGRRAPGAGDLDPGIDVDQLAGRLDVLAVGLALEDAAAAQGQGQHRDQQCVPHPCASSSLLTPRSSSLSSTSLRAGWFASMASRAPR